MDERTNFYVGVDASKSATFSEVVEQLFQYTKMNKAVDQLAILFLQQNKQSISKGSPNADPEALKQTLSCFEEEFAKETPSLNGAITDLYKQTFSFEDVQSVLAFYQSEVGQRFLQGGTQIEQQLQGIAQNWAKEAGQRAFERATARVEAD